MRVLIAHSFYRVPGGEDTFVRSQVDLLSRVHEVKLFSRNNENLREDIGTAVTLLYSKQLVNELDEVIRSFRPHVIHLHNAYPSLGPAVHLASRKHQIPLVMNVHNYRIRCPNSLLFTEGQRCTRCVGGAYYNAVLHPCFPSKRQALTYAVGLWSHRYILRLENDVSRFIVPSRFVLERLLAWGIRAERIALVRHPIDGSLMSSARPGEGGVCVGRLSGEKGLHTLLTALAEAGNPPFTIVGDGPLADPLRQQAAELGLTNTTFTGQLSGTAVQDVVASARYAVVPSDVDETFSLVAAEAMAAGRPIVVSRMGALPELADNSRGLVFEPGNPRDLSRKIKELDSDPELCQMTGERALDFARAEFDPSRHLKNLEGVYGSVVNRSYPSPHD